MSKLIFILMLTFGLCATNPLGIEVDNDNLGIELRSSNLTTSPVEAVNVDFDSLTSRIMYTINLNNTSYVEDAIIVHSQGNVNRAFPANTRLNGNNLEIKVKVNNFEETIILAVSKNRTGEEYFAIIVNPEIFR